MQKNPAWELIAKRWSAVTGAITEPNLSFLERIFRLLVESIVLLVIVLPATFYALIYRPKRWLQSEIDRVVSTKRTDVVDGFAAALTLLVYWLFYAPLLIILFPFNAVAKVFIWAQKCYLFWAEPKAEGDSSAESSGDGFDGNDHGVQHLYEEDTGGMRGIKRRIFRCLRKMLFWAVVVVIFYFEIFVREGQEFVNLYHLVERLISE